MEETRGKKVLHELRKFTQDFAEVLELYNVLTTVSSEIHCLKNDTCFAKFVKESLKKKILDNTKIRLINEVYERFAPLTPPYNQCFLNFLLKKYGAESLREKLIFLLEFDRETKDSIVVENIDIILKSNLKEKHRIVADILEKNKKFLEMVINKNRKHGYELLKFIIEGSQKINGGLVRRAVYLMYKFNKNILKRYNPEKTDKKSLYINMGILDIIRSYVENFDENTIKNFLKQATEAKNACLRMLGYRYGSEIFGEEFLKRALNDKSKSIRKWAEKIIKNRKSKRKGVNIDSLIRMSIKYFENGEYEKSLKCAERILKYEDNTLAKVIKAESLWKLGNFVKAEAILDEVLQKDDILDAYIARAALYIDLGDFKEALNTIDKGLKKYPDNFHLNIVKAQILYWMGDTDYKKYVKKAEEIDPIRAEVFMDSFWIYDLPPTHPLFYKLSEALRCLAEGDYVTVEDFIRNIELLGTPHSEEISKGLRILLLIRRKKFKDAEKLLKAAEKHKKSQIYNVLWMELEIERKNYEKAITYVDKIIENAKERDMPLKELYLIKSSLLEKIGRKREAEYYRRLAEEEYKKS